jgi:hypothetical protein
MLTLPSKQTDLANHQGHETDEKQTRSCRAQKRLFQNYVASQTDTCREHDALPESLTQTWSRFGNFKFRQPQLRKNINKETELQRTTA